MPDTVKEKKKGLPVLYADDFITPEPRLVRDGAPIHRLRLGEAWVIGFTGIRGSGKSLSLALTIAKALIQGMTVWSNMKVEFKCVYGSKNTKVLRTKPLDWNAVYALSHELQNGAVAIDEIEYYADSRTSLTLRNRLLNAVLYQVRKRSLDFYYTVKALDWIDKRLRYWETDIEIHCWDLSRTNPDMPKGTYISWWVYDLSGAWTGKAWFRGMPPTARFMISPADKIWHIYDTKEIIDYMEAMAPVRLDLQERVISDRQTKHTQRLMELYSLVSTLKDDGAGEVPATQFAIMAKKQLGITVETSVLGRQLAEIGVTKKRTRAGSIYSFDSLVDENFFSGDLTKAI